MKDIDSAQQLCRTQIEKRDEPNPKARRGLRRPWTPPPEWRETFRAQATSEAIDDVVAYTASHATWVEYKTGRRNPGTVEEMVHDSLGDTFAGVVSWDPARCSLAMHLKSVIRSRLSHELERAEQYKHLRVHEVADAAVSGAIAFDAAPSTTGRRNLCAEEFATCLRALAAGDEPVLQLIECYRDGITERRKVCRATGMTAATFHNADRRLHRLVKRLPDHVRADALAGMSRDDP
jgi:hypothetical protein